jgi:hypothetical protein
VNEKRKLILHSAVDCLFIVLFCGAMVAHTGFIFLLIGLYGVYSKKLFQKKHGPKTQWRELTTLETIAFFAIGFSFLWILGFVVFKGLLSNLTFMIPIGIIGLAIRSLAFAKDWAASQTSAPVSN